MTLRKVPSQKRGAIPAAGHVGKPEPQRMKPPVILSTPIQPTRIAANTLGPGATQARAPKRDNKAGRGQGRPG